PEPSTALEAPAEPAHDGFISDGRFTYAGDNAVSAVRQFRGTVTRIGAIGRWNQTRRGAESTMAIAITPTANLTQAMVHLAVNRSAWELTIRRQGGKSESIARGHFSPILSLNRDYLIEMEVDADNLTVRVPGKAITENVQLDGLLGDY